LRQAQVEREQVECIALGLGPGSYNGIRLSIAIAQGWDLASDEGRIKLLGISSAECIAAEAGKEGLEGRVVVVVDAQRSEFYVAMYEIGSAESREVEPLALASLDQLKAREAAGEH